MSTIVAQITSNLGRAGEPPQLLIEVASPEGQLSSLLHNSLVSCSNLTTIESSRINKVIGPLPPALMQKVNDCLKGALELPQERWETVRRSAEPSRTGAARLAAPTAACW